jgi:hypothetical protein
VGGRARFDTQLALIKVSSKSSRPEAALSAAVVAKLELDPEILPLQESNDRLQLVT